jgi:hypothetical protein
LESGAWNWTTYEYKQADYPHSFFRPARERQLPDTHMWALLRRPLHRESPGDNARVHDRDHVRDHAPEWLPPPGAGGIQGMLDAVEPVPRDAQPPGTPPKVDGHRTTLKKHNPLQGTQALQGTQGMDLSTLRKVLHLDLRFRS